MSWQLVSKSGETYYLLPTSVCRIGRQGCQILVQDATVSRHHADVIVNRNTVMIRDVSKFVQTQVNGNLLTVHRREQHLNTGDVVIFGSCHETFILVYEPVVIVVADESASTSETDFGVIVDREWRYDASAVVCDTPMASNYIVLRALLDRKPIVCSQYLQAILNTQSGARSLPSISDNCVTVPYAAVDRTTLLAGWRFHIMADQDCAHIIKLAGGSVVQELNKPEYDLVLVSHDTKSQMLFNVRITDARIMSPALVFRAVFNASVDEIRKSPQTTLGPLETDRTAGSFTQSEWISTSRTNISCSFKNDMRESSVPTKRFKKARISVHEDDVVPLQTWTGNVLAKRRNENDIVLKTARNDIDEWLDSYNSQN